MAVRCSHRTCEQECSACSLAPGSEGCWQDASRYRKYEGADFLCHWCGAHADTLKEQSLLERRRANTPPLDAPNAKQPPPSFTPQTFHIATPPQPSPPPKPPPKPPPAAPVPPPGEQDQEVTQLRQEVAQLRMELAQLKQALARLQNDSGASPAGSASNESWQVTSSWSDPSYATSEAGTVSGEQVFQ